MKKIIVTAGDKNTDIDVLACSIAYSELLNKESKTSKAVIMGPFQNNITSEIKSWPLKYSTRLPRSDNKFVIVDCSDPVHFSKFANDDQVIKIFDHHAGFVSYWKERLGQNAHIELIGACATLIWEEFKKRKSDKNISTTSAKLLYTAIASNTLNFKASVTNTRDLAAFKELHEHVDLPARWIKNYFMEQENVIHGNPEFAIQSDTRILSRPQFKHSLIISQIELWNSSKFVRKYPDVIEKKLASHGSDYWFLTSPSISEGKNYLFTKNPKMKKLLKRITNAKFKGDIGTTDKLWLRKEILGKLEDFK